MKKTILTITIPVLVKEVRTIETYKTIDEIRKEATINGAEIFFRSNDYKVISSKLDEGSVTESYENEATYKIDGKEIKI